MPRSKTGNSLRGGFVVVRVLPALVLGACLSDSGEFTGDATELATPTQQTGAAGALSVQQPMDQAERLAIEQAVDEDTLDPGRANAIASMKRSALGDSVVISKHASCGTSGPTGASTRNNDAPSGEAARQRSGSSTGCTAHGVLQPSDDAYYYCYTVASDNYTWTYNQNIRTGVRGWTRDDLLDDGGSFNYCGF